MKGCTTYAIEESIHGTCSITTPRQSVVCVRGGGLCVVRSEGVWWGCVCGWGVHAQDQSHAINNLP